MVVNKAGKGGGIVFGGIVEEIVALPDPLPRGAARSAIKCFQLQTQADLRVHALNRIGTVLSAGHHHG